RSLTLAARSLRTCLLPLLDTRAEEWYPNRHDRTPHTFSSGVSTMQQPHFVGMDRRGFLHAGAATLGLAGLPTLLHAEDKKKADEFGGFTLGVQSYSFRNFKLEP